MKIGTKIILSMLFIVMIILLSGVFISVHLGNTFYKLNYNLLNDIGSLQTMIDHLQDIDIDARMAHHINPDEVTELNTLLDEYQKNIQDHHDEAKDTLTVSQITAFIISVIAVFISIILGLYLKKSIAQPIQQLKDKTKAVSDGDLESQIQIHSNDEIGQLAADFNSMVKKLKYSLAKEKESIKIKATAEAHQKKAEELMALNQKLLANEKELKSKQKELKETNIELSKSKSQLAEQIKNLRSSNKALIGREMRIIELKNKLEKLKKEKGNS